MPVMNNKNDLHGNRVVHGDDQGQSAGAEQQPQSYGEAKAAKKEHEKQSAQEGVQKAGKTAGAAVGAYLGGSAGAKVGAKVGDAVAKSKIASSDIDFCFAGDLLNQCISSSFGLRDSNIPFFGIFGACSTFVEGLDDCEVVLTNSGVVFSSLSWFMFVGIGLIVGSIF